MTAAAESPLVRVEVPAREGRAVSVRSGERVRIIDVEGGQVGDVFVFAHDDLGEFHSASHTRAVVDRLFPVVGESFVTNRRRPVLTLVEDSSPGRHDMLIAACDPQRYQSLGAADGHASCAENLARALAAVGRRVDVVPQPINIFMDIPVSPEGALSWRTSSSRPGDSITFEAEMDCLVVVSACPQDLVEINSGIPTGLSIEILTT